MTHGDTLDNRLTFSGRSVLPGQHLGQLSNKKMRSSTRDNLVRDSHIGHIGTTCLSSKYCPERKNTTF